LTDGRVTLDIHGNETKSIAYRDLDAIGIGRRAGYDFAFVTGEDSEMARFFAARFKVDRLYTGAKDKLAAVTAISDETGIPLNNLIYIGDSDRDVPALEAVGLGIAPCDASPKAQKAANFLTECKGGFGVLLEVVNNLVDGVWK
jgi:YrbI family 3-deoxy-D-manno-octulosonate 8-phosphate phosphatase